MSTLINNKHQFDAGLAKSPIFGVILTEFQKSARFIFIMNLIKSSQWAVSHSIFFRSLLSIVVLTNLFQEYSAFLEVSWTGSKIIYPTEDRGLSSLVQTLNGLILEPGFLKARSSPFLFLIFINGSLNEIGSKYQSFRRRHKSVYNSWKPSQFCFTS